MMIIRDWVFQKCRVDNYRIELVGNLGFGFKQE